MSGLGTPALALTPPPRTTLTVPKLPRIDNLVAHQFLIGLPVNHTQSPATLQRLLEVMFSDLSGILVFVYPDDICIFSYDLNILMDNLQEIIHQLHV